MSKTKRHRGRPQQRLALGPVIRVNINLSRPEAISLRAAAKRAQLPVATWVRSIVVPIALNALADEAAESNKRLAVPN